MVVFLLMVTCPTMIDGHPAAGTLVRVLQDVLGVSRTYKKAELGFVTMMADDPMNQYPGCVMVFFGDQSQDYFYPDIVEPVMSHDNI